jgi:hypothetical protein
MTQVTDAGLAYLFDMPHLRDVTVLGSRATRIGLGALRGHCKPKAGRCIEVFVSFGVRRLDAAFFFPRPCIFPDVAQPEGQP